MQIGQWVNSFPRVVLPIEVPFDTGFSTSQTDWKPIGSFRILSLGRKSFRFLRHLYLMRRLWDPTRWPLSAVALALSLSIPIIAVEVPCRLCLLPSQSLSPCQQIPIARAPQHPAVCIARGVIAETKTSKAAAAPGGLNRMFVQRLRARLEEFNSRRGPCTAKVPEPAGLWSKTLWREADGDMNSAAGPRHPRPLPCVLHITSTNASHNWCAGMVPIIAGFCRLAETSRSLPLLQLSILPRRIVLKLLGERWTPNGRVCVCVCVWSSGVNAYFSPCKCRYISH